MFLDRGFTHFLPVIDFLGGVEHLASADRTPMFFDFFLPAGLPFRFQDILHAYFADDDFVCSSFPSHVLQLSIAGQIYDFRFCLGNPCKKNGGDFLGPAIWFVGFDRGEAVIHRLRHV